MLRWPDKADVDRAARDWARQTAEAREELVAAGYFGSYARGDWGVGSDLDLVLIVSQTELPFTRRALAYDVLSLPVPADVLVYTEEEWERLLAEGSAFARRISQEAVWLHPEE